MIVIGTTECYQLQIELGASFGWYLLLLDSQDSETGEWMPSLSNALVW